MARLKLSDLASEKPVRLTLEIPARLYRELAEYARAVNGGNPDSTPPIELIIPAMLDRSIATDREFAKSSKTAGKG